MNLKRILVPLLLAGVCVLSARAQLVTGRFTTSVYTWEKFDTVGVSTTNLRAFQTAQLSVAQGDVALHTYLLGASNATDAFSDRAMGRIRVYNLYLSWSNIGRVVDLDAGRQAVYAGVANGTIDGLVARARLLKNQVTITGFGGATVNNDFGGIRKNVHDNATFGGQVVTSAVADARIGVSYLNRREERDDYWAIRARDTSFVPYTVHIANDSPAEELGSADVYYTCGTTASVYGRYDYDFKFARTSRGQGGARVNVTPALAVTADYIYRVPRVAYNSIFSAFVANSVSEIEGGLEYGFTPMLRAFGRVAHVSYTDDKSTRWTLGCNAGYGSVSYSGSDGFSGQLQSVNVQGAYPLLQNRVVPTLGASYASYRLSSDGPRDHALSVMLGAIVRPVSEFSVDVQGQWLTNRILNRDLRLQVKLMYWFAERLSIFPQEVKQ
jgi:hypothetical protein